jgi:hypothetical protein
MNSTSSTTTSASAVTRCLALALALSTTALQAQAAPMCSARSPAASVSVIELYTSEGCNSCPPADRWLSSLKGRPDVVALAYHVDYWDRLGWKDRFASPAFTQRQYEQLGMNGSRFAYTPQVVVDGRDTHDWSRAGAATGRAASPVLIELSRDATDKVSARVSVVGQPPARLAAYWAITESGHRTVVKAGENDGATLQHDFVVREFEAVPAWSPSREHAQALTHSIGVAADATHLRRVNLVVVDAANGKPVQALAAECP